MLIGKVTRDDMQAAGTSEFALRFDQAQLKNGKTLPIKATIVDIRRPSPEDDNYAASNDWTSQTLTVKSSMLSRGWIFTAKYPATTPPSLSPPKNMT